MSSPFSNLPDAAPEDAARYIQAVLSLLGDRDSREVLGETANRLREVLEVFDRERLALPEAPGKWSAADVLHHFADSELVWGWRLRMLLTADRPTLQGYDQDTWADRRQAYGVDRPRCPGRCKATTRTPGPIDSIRLTTIRPARSSFSVCCAKGTSI